MCNTPVFGLALSARWSRTHDERGATYGESLKLHERALSEGALWEAPALQALASPTSGKGWRGNRGVQVPGKSTQLGSLATTSRRPSSSARNKRATNVETTPTKAGSGINEVEV